MWEEVLICILVYAGIFFLLPDSIRRPLISKRYLLQTIVGGLALVYLSAWGLHKLTRQVEKFQISGACGGVKCPSACMFNADLSATGALTNITYKSGYDNCLLTGMDISGVLVSGAVKVTSVSGTAGQLDSTKTYTAKPNALLVGTTNPVCYVNTAALGNADIDQSIGFNLYGRYVRIYAPKDESICSFTATVSASGALSNITVTSGQLVQGSYIYGTNQANGVVLTVYSPASKTGQLDPSKVYTAGSVSMTSKLGDGFFGLSQVMVYNAKGENIAAGKATSGTKSTYQGGGTAASVVDGTTIPRGAPNGTDMPKAWGNTNIQGRDADYWEVDLGSRNMVVNVRIVGANNYGDTRNVSGGGGNRIKGLRIAVLEDSSMMSSMTGTCGATPTIIYPTLTTGSQMTDTEKGVVGQYILKGMDGEKVVRMYRVVSGGNFDIGDLVPAYLTGDQVAIIYRGLENNNNTKAITAGLITDADNISRKAAVRLVKTMADIPQTTTATMNNFKDAVAKYKTNNTANRKSFAKDANGSTILDATGNPTITVVSDGGLPALFGMIVDPLKPVGQGNSSLGYSSAGPVSGTTVDGSIYPETNDIPDLSAAGTPTANATAPGAITNADGSITIPESGSLSDIDKYLRDSGYQPPTGGLSKALPQWYLVVGALTYDQAVQKCADSGDKLVTLPQIKAAQTAGARFNGGGWIKDVVDRVYTIQDTPSTYNMVRAPYSNCPAGTTGNVYNCSVTQDPVPVTNCPAGTTASPTGCSVTITTKNFDCPGGLVPTTSGCNSLPLTTVSRSCPAGTTASPTGCSVVLSPINFTGCPATVTTASPTGCQLNSKNRLCYTTGNYFDASPTGCKVNNPNIGYYNSTTARSVALASSNGTCPTGTKKYNTSTTGCYATLTDCPASAGYLLEILSGGVKRQTCYNLCPYYASLSYTPFSPPSCNSATGYCSGTHGQIINNTCYEFCPAGTTLSGTKCVSPDTTCPGQMIGDTCYPSCPAGTTLSGTTCVAEGTCPGRQIILGACYPSCPAGTTLSGTMCGAPGSCSGQVNGGQCYPSCPAATTISGTNCIATGTCAGRQAGGTCYPSCPAKTAANGANCESAGTCATPLISGMCYYPCEAGETASGTTCTGSTVSASDGFLKTLTNTGLITVNKSGRYVVVLNKPGEWINLTQVFIKDTAGNVISKGATATAYNPVVIWDSQDMGTNAGAQRLLQYDTLQQPKEASLGYLSKSYSDNQFIQIDLGSSKNIATIQIVPRGDCCGFGQTNDRVTGLRVVVSDVAAPGCFNVFNAHCYGVKTSYWPSGQASVASWTNRDIAIPDGQIVPPPSASSTPNQAPGAKIDIANVYTAGDWNKRSKNDPLKDKEVFHVSSRYIYTKAEAQAVCQLAGGDLATVEQMTRAQAGGAQWCSTGWLKDSDTAYYPMQDGNITACNTSATPQLQSYTPTLAGANCYGIKPSRLENLFILTNTGIITANKKGRYIRIFNTDKPPNITNRYMALSQILITDSDGNVVSKGATAIAENKPMTISTKDALYSTYAGTVSRSTDAVAQSLLQYDTIQPAKNWPNVYHSATYDEDQFIEIDLGKAFADRGGKIGTIQIVPRGDCCGFGQSPDFATGLRVVISNLPYIYPFSNQVGAYSWTQTLLNNADSCGLSSDGLMKYKKTCDLGGGRKINVCVTDMTIGCDQICTDGKTLQGKDCATSSGIPNSQYGAECDISFDFQMYQIGYLYSGKGDPGGGAASSNPYHSRDMAAVTVSCYQKCEDQDQTKGTWKALDVGWCWKDVWYAGCPANYDDWNGVLHVCCTCYQPSSVWTGPDTYATTCTGGHPVVHTGSWLGPDTYERTYFTWWSIGGDPVLHTGIWTGPDTYERICLGGHKIIHSGGGDTIPKISDTVRSFARKWEDRNFTDPVRWAQAQRDVASSITRYFGGIQRATMTITGRCEGVKRKYTAIESSGINYLRAYAQELSSHNNSTGGATYKTLVRSFVNSADIKSCDNMRSTWKSLFGVETGIDSQPCSEGGPMLFWKKQGDENGRGACPWADGIPDWTASTASTATTGRTFMDHILKHAIIAAPAPYAYKYNSTYKADIAKLKSGNEWDTGPTVIPVNGDSPAKPNFSLLSIDARCSTTQDAIAQVMFHVAAAVWAGQAVTPYFGSIFSTEDDVIEACMRQGDNPIGGLWILDAVAGNNFTQTRIFSNPVIGRYVRVRPSGTGSTKILHFKQITVKDPAGNRIPASRVYATSTYSSWNAGYAYDGVGGGLYHGAKSGWDAYYNEFWEVDLGGNKSIGSITYRGREDCCPSNDSPDDRVRGTRISVWPSKIGWDIPVEPFSTIDQKKTTIDRMVAAKVLDGTVKNYSQCVDNGVIQGWAYSAQLPGDYGALNQTRVRICSPYFNNPGYKGGDTSDDRKGDYKLNIGATNR